MVIPSAPKFWQLMAASSTEGEVPPLALRMVAILFIFTLSFVIINSKSKK
jgi:hypothetical protein